MGEPLKLKWMAAGLGNPLDQSQALYEAALTEFAAHSFQDASLNDILKAADMNKGSFYYRFSDKMELYLSLLYRVGMEKLKLFKEAGVSKSSGGFFDEFRNMAILGLRMAQKDVRSSSSRGEFCRRPVRSRTDHKDVWKPQRNASDRHGGARKAAGESGRIADRNRCVCD